MLFRSNGEEIIAEEDDVVIFDGSLKHCARPPIKGRRVVLIVTYYDF